jgi:hypothetical protein
VVVVIFVGFGCDNDGDDGDLSFGDDDGGDITVGDSGSDNDGNDDDRGNKTNGDFGFGDNDGGEITVGEIAFGDNGNGRDDNGDNVHITTSYRTYPPPQTWIMYTIQYLINDLLSSFSSKRQDHRGVGTVHQSPNMDLLREYHKFMYHIFHEVDHLQKISFLCSFHACRTVQDKTKIDIAICSKPDI